jgi:pimeloyl-ACP methyl ester carboxylesterase
MGSIAAVEKQTVVLVHGAWHTSDCWDSVTSLLKEHQYPFQTIQLPSSGGDLTTTVADDAAYIRKFTSELVAAGKDVILVLHSYGGIPGTESAKGLLKKDREAEQKSGGIVSLVYVTAFLIPPGATLASFLGGMPPWIIFEVSHIST